MIFQVIVVRIEKFAESGQLKRFWTTNTVAMIFRQWSWSYDFKLLNFGLNYSLSRANYRDSEHIKLAINFREWSWSYDFLKRPNFGLNYCRRSA